MKIFRYIALALAVLLSAGCVKEYLEVDQSKVPQASELQIRIEVDQETNYVTFYLDNEKMVPMWMFGTEKIDGRDNKKYAYTGSGIKLRFREQGEHTVEVKAFNAHGVSIGSVTKTFSLNETYRDPFDPTKYKTMLAGSESKTWEWNSTEAAHFGCGPTATDPASWWSAKANEKDGLGLYDDRLTFSADGKYTYNPGEGGTVYVNTGSGYGNDYNTNDGQDYQVPIETFTAGYTFENIWNDAGIEDVYLVLDQGANLSYIPNQAALDDPRYLILEQTTKKITLSHATPDIAWKYQFILEGSAKPEDDKPVDGEVVFDPNSDRNMWKKAVTTDHHFWFANNDWGEISPATVTSEGGTHTFVLPAEIGSQQWQGQFFFQNTGLATSASKTYDFYLVLNSTADHAGVTVKLCAQDDDAAIISDGRYALKAFEDYVVKVVAAPGIDCENLKLVFDFGGGQGGSSVVVKDIILQEHIDAGGSGEVTFDPDGAENFWNTANTTEMTYYYAPGWAQIADPGFTASGNNYTISLPEATTDQWQAQVCFANTGMAATVDKTYDFYLLINSTQDHPCFTIKLTQNDNDNVFFFADRHELTAYEDYVYKVVGMPGIDASNLKLVLDFGGNAAGTEVVVKDIIFRESQAPAGGGDDGSGDDSTMDPTSPDNLWLSMTVEEMFYYYAPGWAQIANPELTQNGNSYTISLPEATTDQWQAQVAFRTTMSSAADKTYDFYCVVNSTQDINGATIKLVKTGDDNTFYFADRHNLVAYEDYVYKVTDMAGIDMEKISLFFDFGGNPAGTEVTVKDIIFQEHK